MKKWLVFLLAVIVMAGAGDACCIDGCTKNEPSASSDREEHPEKGHCSPFFACATCPDFVSSIKLPRLSQPVTSFIQHHGEETAFFTSSYYPFVFQPPRPALS